MPLDRASAVRGPASPEPAIVLCLRTITPGSGLKPLRCS